MNDNGFVLKGAVYDVLKWIALVLLPGLAALYFGLGQIWNFPAVEQVVGSITVLDTFLGLLLGRSSRNYTVQEFSLDTVGDIVVTQDRFGTVTGMRMEADRDPLILPEHETVAFNVKRAVEDSD
jgi:hypothetical protein